MPNPTKATIGGKPAVNTSAVQWRMQPGTQPFTAEFDLSHADADQLVKGSLKPVDLVLESGPGNITVKGLFVIHKTGGPNPEVARVVVVDRRYFWNRAIVSRRYNIHRHIGVKRVQSPGTAPTAMPVVDDIQFAPWSLFNDKTAWTATQVLEDVMKRIKAAESGVSGLSGDADIDLGGVDALPIQNLILESTADAALSTVLGYLPEAQVTITESGAIRIYSRASGADGPIIEDAPGIVDGDVIQVQHARVRPRRIEVFFTRELEILFKHEEGTASRGKNDRFTENVLPVPDHTLDTSLGKLVQSTWVSISVALAAWPSPPGNIPFNLTTIRRALVPFMDLWAPLQLAGQRDPDADWPSRIAAIQMHYRRTYRINRRWMDRILKLKAKRVATIDPETGTRGPALGYADHFLMGTQRSLVADIQGGQELAFGMNVSGYPTDGKLSNVGTKNAPARLTIVDHDEGIIRLEYAVDETRMREMILPSKITNIPDMKLHQKSTPIAWNAILRGARHDNVPTLSATHNVLFLLTAIPAAPNTEDRLHKIDVNPDDVKDMLPPALRGGVGDARGPVVQILIGTGTETARVAWVDDRAKDIERAFGVTKGKPKLDDLIINSSSSGKGASLEAIANAAAARVYAEYSDRWQGEMTVGPYSASVDGFLDMISHEVDAQGRFTTKIAAGSQAPNISFKAFLPRDVQAVLMRLADPEK